MSLITNRDTSKIFLFDNKYVKRTFKNISGGALTLNGGEVIGAIRTGGDAGNYYLCGHTATDGTQIPFGVNKSATAELADDETIEITICVAGDVAASKLTFAGATTLASLSDSVVGDDTDIRSIQDRLMSDTLGIYLQTTDELTGYDNE